MEEVPINLTQQYNTAAPRYTSYPTVPYWDNENWQQSTWLNAIKLAGQPKQQAVSLYVHLPFCEEMCTYCGCHTRITKNHAVELPYIDLLIKEWDLYKRALNRPIHLKEIHLGGGTPTFFSATNLRHLIENLLEGVIVDPEPIFSFEAHPANTSFAHLSVLYELGFTRLSLGIQDFDPQVQAIIHRRQSPADVIRIVQDARYIGYRSINFDLIYGLPLQTKKGIVETAEIALAMKPDRISFYSYAHVPWVKPSQRKFSEKDLPQGEEKLALYLAVKERIKEAGYHDIGLDHFALPTDSLYHAYREGHLHRNFMGYSELQSELLIGLGVSSISDAGTAFSQNVKKMEEYQQLIEAGKLPLLKGHALTEEDLQLRKHILHIMCKGYTQWQRHDPMMEKIYPRLEPLEEDGLIDLSHQHLEVTPIGKSFLRNICMAFDERLHSGKDKEPFLFSKAI